MSEESKKNKKRKKSYYKKCSNKRQKFLHNLDVDMRGFLITCNSNEKQAVRESYNILNEYSDTLYGPEQLQPEKSAENSGESSDGDMEKEIQKEVAALKKTEQSVERRFQNVNTKAKNCIFIKTTLEDPCQLAHSILTDLALSKTPKTRFALRLLPISGTCRAVESDVETLAMKLFPQHFDTEQGLGFTINYRVRNNDSIGRKTILPLLGQVIRDMNALHRVCHDEPDIVILVEIVGKICCMSVVKEFLKLRKYNLHEVTKSDIPENETELEEEKNQVKNDVLENSETKRLENITNENNNEGSNSDNNTNVKTEKEESEIVPVV